MNSSQQFATTEDQFEQRSNNLTVEELRTRRKQLKAHRLVSSGEQFYGPEFKVDAAMMDLHDGRLSEEVAMTIGISPTLLRRWSDQLIEGDLRLFEPSAVRS